MTTISIMNLKGGVGKTISAINIAFILAIVHSKRVLLVDNDKQGNTTKFFGLHSEKRPSISEVLTEKKIDPYGVILKTGFSGLDVIPANMNLAEANKKLILDTDIMRYARIQRALRIVGGDYDYCIIDNAPDINMSTINSLAASNYVMIPIKLDQFALDGLDILLKEIEGIKEVNSGIQLAGCFTTVYYRGEESALHEQALRSDTKYNLFDTHIRRTPKVDDSTYAGMPLMLYSKTCGASRDYIKLTDELLQRIGQA